MLYFELNFVIINMSKTNVYTVNVLIKDVYKKFKVLENEWSYGDSVKGSIDEQSIIHDLTKSYRVPSFKLKFPHNDKMVRKKPVSKNRKKVAAWIDRVICYSLIFAENEKSVIPYLDMVNSKDNSFITSISATKIIAFVESTLKITEAFGNKDESEIKVVNFMDYKAFFINDIQENEIQLRYRPTSGQEKLKLKYIILYTSRKS